MSTSYQRHSGSFELFWLDFGHFCWTAEGRRPYKLRLFRERTVHPRSSVAEVDRTSPAAFNGQYAGPCH